MGDDLKFKYENFESVGRTTRSIIMMIDAAMERLRANGYDRVKDKINIEQEDDGSHHITIGKARVFSVVIVSGDQRVEIVGSWTDKEIPRPKR